MIEDLGLHDATLLEVRVAWAEGSCTLALKHTRLGDCKLTFTGLSDLRMTRVQAWGPSRSILTATGPRNGSYEVALQCGDVIDIVADGVELVPAATSD